MPIDRALFELAAQQLQAAQRVLITCHLRPDGDALGALLGLGLALQGAGKTVYMVSGDGVPASLRYLLGSEQVHNRVGNEAGFDLVCILDCSDLERIKGILPEGIIPDLNIDHHLTNLNFARLNLVDASAAATVQIIAELLAVMGLPLNEVVTSALLTGLITDTIGFRTNNVTPQTLRLAASLMESGADLHGLYRMALVNRSFEAARFWGAGLVKLEREGRMIWTALSLADREAARYPGRDDADLVNMLSAINGSDIVVIFMEQADGRVKVSWRSQPGFDISQIALRFGGGGHPNASGAEVRGSMQEVQEAVLVATRPLLIRNGVSLAKEQ